MRPRGVFVALLALFSRRLVVPARLISVMFRGVQMVIVVVGPHRGLLMRCCCAQMCVFSVVVSVGGSLVRAHRALLRLLRVTLGVRHRRLGDRLARLQFGTARCQFVGPPPRAFAPVVRRRRDQSRLKVAWGLSP
jgi:hypothetical protein